MKIKSTDFAETLVPISLITQRDFPEHIHSCFYKVSKHRTHESEGLLILLLLIGLFDFCAKQLCQK
jgi:hypothetical protein